MLHLAVYGSINIGELLKLINDERKVIALRNVHQQRKHLFELVDLSVNCGAKLLVYFEQKFFAE